MGVDLQHQHAACGQVAMTEFGYRAATQTDHADSRRGRVKEQKAHHGAGVVHLELPGAGREHAALQFTQSEMQRFARAVVPYKRLDVLKRQEIASARCIGLAARRHGGQAGRSGEFGSMGLFGSAAGKQFIIDARPQPAFLRKMGQNRQIVQ